jgi:hypothetical protein
MAAEAQEPDVRLLSSLADYAHKLMLEFAGLSYTQNDRAAELLAELEHVIAEFKRLRPPPTFKGARTLRLIPIENRACVRSVSGRSISASGTISRPAARSITAPVTRPLSDWTEPPPLQTPKSGRHHLLRPSRQ